MEKCREWILHSFPVDLPYAHCSHFLLCVGDRRQYCCAFLWKFRRPSRRHNCDSLVPEIDFRGSREVSIDRSPLLICACAWEKLFNYPQLVSRKDRLSQFTCCFAQLETPRFTITIPQYSSNDLSKCVFSRDYANSEALDGSPVYKRGYGGLRIA